MLSLPYSTKEKIIKQKKQKKPVILQI